MKVLHDELMLSRITLSKIHLHTTTLAAVFIPSLSTDLRMTTTKQLIYIVAQTMDWLRFILS